MSAGVEELIGKVIQTPSSDLEPAPTQAPRLFTYDELSAVVQETNQPHELWDGELIMAPSPIADHQRIASNFFKSLDGWVRKQSLGEVFFAPIDMVLSPHRSMQPDVAFIARENLGIIRDVIRGPADLVAEIVSPSSRQRDRIDKKDLYEQHSVKEYWIIDPEARSVDVLALDARQYSLAGRNVAGETAASVLLAGFTVAVDTLFAGIKP